MVLRCDVNFSTERHPICSFTYLHTYIHIHKYIFIILLLASREIPRFWKLSRQTVATTAANVPSIPIWKKPKNCFPGKAKKTKQEYQTKRAAPRDVDYYSLLPNTAVSGFIVLRCITLPLFSSSFFHQFPCLTCYFLYVSCVSYCFRAPQSFVVSQVRTVANDATHSPLLNPYLLQ